MQWALGQHYDIQAGRCAIRTAMAHLGLETLYQKPKTTFSNKAHRIYPYLLRHVPITHPNHVWSVDITYIPLPQGFCYLVAIIDWYSRKVLSWRVSPTMEHEFCIEALEEALGYGTPRIHNSDQGVQFTSEGYLAPLITKEISISMDGRGRCLDNIFVERLWRTVKYEDIYLKGYSTLAEVRAGLNEFFPFYNNERPHQSLRNQFPSSVYAQKKS